MRRGQNDQKPVNIELLKLSPLSVWLLLEYKKKKMIALKIGAFK